VRGVRGGSCTVAYFTARVATGNQRRTLVLIIAAVVCSRVINTAPAYPPRRSPSPLLPPFLHQQAEVERRDGLARGLTRRHRPSRARRFRVSAR